MPARPSTVDPGALMLYKVVVVASEDFYNFWRDIDVGRVTVWSCHLRQLVHAAHVLAISHKTNDH